MELALRAGKTVVTAARTDAWDGAKRGTVRLLGRRDPQQEQLVERRLEETRERLAGAEGDLKSACAVLTAQWTTRLADLLEDDPNVEADLRALVRQIQAELPPGTVPADEHLEVAAQHTNPAALGGAIATREIQGSVVPPSSTRPGPEQQSGPGLSSANAASVLGPDWLTRERIARIEIHQTAASAQRTAVRLAPRPVFLAGREELLAELYTRLTGGDGSGPRIVALCGLGGTGKSSVALEYAHRRLGEIGLAWQFPAEDAAVLGTGFGQLAAQLASMDLPQQQDPIAAVHTVLRSHGVEWLLIFDNAPDPAAVMAFLPRAGPGQVLITSQNPNWPWPVLEVPVLDPDVAASFLVSRTRDPDRQAAAELASELGGLPLALEQAAAYLQATSKSLASYLALFQKAPQAVLEGFPAHYGRTVTSTWALAFEQLEKSPGAVGLLRLLAFYAPEAIPLGLMLQSSTGLIEKLGPDVAPKLAPLLEDPLGDDKAIAALRRYSLVTSAADGYTSVHPLVQVLTRNQIEPEHFPQWHHAAAALIEAAIPANTNSPDTWDVCATMLPHAQKALADESVGMARIASYLGHSGSHKAARNLQTKIARACARVHRPDHPRTLSARHELAHWTGQAGDPAAARDQFADLLPIRERVLGPEDPETLITRAGVAGWTGEAGDPAGARDQFANLLPIIDWVRGPDDPETLITRASLARWTGEAGDPAGARDQFANLLPIIKQVFGGAHLDTLTARHNLAHWTGKAGHPAAARDQFADLRPAIENVFGPRHPLTLRARAGLAWWTGEAGDPGAAHDQFMELLPIIEQVFGGEHPETLAARANLARWRS